MEMSHTTGNGLLPLISMVDLMVLSPHLSMVMSSNPEATLSSPEVSPPQ